LTKAGLATNATIAVAAIGALVFLPLEWLPKCPIHSLTGLLCPGCGSQRAAIALLDGDLKTAISLNSLLMSTPLFVATISLAKMKKLRWLEISTVAVAAVAMVGFTIIRNI
jgi:hypothetical protein